MEPDNLPQQILLHFQGGTTGETPAMILSPTTRRRQRGRGVVVLDNVTAASNMTNRTAFTPEFLNRFDGASNNLPGLMATPSPDELVIQARGRRRFPLTFSPDVYHTPVRQRHRMSSLASASQTNPGMTRLLLPTRTSPRKRLTLSDSPPNRSSTRCCSVFETPSPDARLKRSPISKKCKLALDTQLSDTPLNTLMKGLSQSQLTGLMAKLMAQHPELEREVAELMPQPDLAPLEERLNYLKRNVFKSLPNTRLESKSDSLAYNRVATHLVALKKALSDQSKQLLDSCQWGATVDHTIMAWNYVKATPVWDNSPHNNVRRQSFKILAVNCLHALKRGDWSPTVCQDIRNRLGPLEKESEDITPCLKHLDFIIQAGEVVHP
ncbi:hypothetical protein TCAL_01054 [Tigriopus californicus]|uniref:Uncharacterized protein n=1 Tax=Tigriopus californicus TaxID=6832 RepID=A0A553P266_TIGCA|nr:uncharacterized protein LOC131884243 [Tigriopus californicus]TRY71795.1 hypothetical protein TCAL_01054 [Tigriopus californicus]